MRINVAEILLFLVAMIIVTRAIDGIRRERRIKRSTRTGGGEPVCATCGYSVRGLVGSLVCPECGSDFRRVGIVFHPIASAPDIGMTRMLSGWALLAFAMFGLNAVVSPTVQSLLPRQRTYAKTIQLQTRTRTYVLSSSATRWDDRRPTMPVEVRLTTQSLSTRPVILRYADGYISYATAGRGVAPVRVAMDETAMLAWLSKVAGQDGSDPQLQLEARTLIAALPQAARGSVVSRSYTVAAGGGTFPGFVRAARTVSTTDESIPYIDTAVGFAFVIL